MEQNTYQNAQLAIQTKSTPKDFFLHFGSMIALYVTVGNLINLLFTVINKAYPQITSGYYYGSMSYSISFPVASIIIMFPIFIILMWMLEKNYAAQPEKKNLGLKKWLTYITLFISGCFVAGDLITVLYYFLDGQELTTGFLLKVFVVLVVALGVFLYYLADVRNTLTTTSHKIWRVIACVVVIASVVIGFSVIGSPRSQQLIKYDEQKVSDLQNINSQVQNYAYAQKKLPGQLGDISSSGEYTPMDAQSGKAYEYIKVSASDYQLCAEFNTASDTKSATLSTIYMPLVSWSHPVGHFCFKQTVNLSESGSPKVVPTY